VFVDRSYYCNVRHLDVTLLVVGESGLYYSGLNVVAPILL